MTLWASKEKIHSTPPTAVSAKKLSLAEPLLGTSFPGSHSGDGERGARV